MSVRIRIMVRLGVQTSFRLSVQCSSASRHKFKDRVGQYDGPCQGEDSV